MLQRWVVLHVSKQTERTASYNTSWLVTVQTTQTPQCTGRMRWTGDTWQGPVSSPKNRPDTTHYNHNLTHQNNYRYARHFIKFLPENHGKRGEKCKNILRMWRRRSYWGCWLLNDRHTVEMSGKKGKNYISSHNFFYVTSLLLTNTVLHNRNISLTTLFSRGHISTSMCMAMHVLIFQTNHNQKNLSIDAVSHTVRISP